MKIIFLMFTKKKIKENIQLVGLIYLAKAEMTRSFPMS